MKSGADCSMMDRMSALPSPTAVNVIGSDILEMVI